MICKNRYNFFIRLVGIILAAVILFISAGCSCEKADVSDSSSAAIPAVSSKEVGSSADSLITENEQNEGSDIGIENSNNLVQETPLEDVAALTGRWEYIYPESEGYPAWVFVLNFSENRTFEAFSAPERLGADIGFNGDFTVSNGCIFYDGAITDTGRVYFEEKIRGNFLASITKDGKLILRKDEAQELFEWVILADVEYTKVQQ